MPVVSTPEFTKLASSTRSSTLATLYSDALNVPFAPVTEVSASTYAWSFDTGSAIKPLYSSFATTLFCRDSVKALCSAVSS